MCGLLTCPNIPFSLDNVIFLWSRDVGNESGENNLLSGTGNKENWRVVKCLRGHLEDVYDLCWSSDSSHVITGSVDNSAIVWDVQRGMYRSVYTYTVYHLHLTLGQQVNVLKDSRQYVQGVAWDPLGKVVVTLSNDRFVHSDTGKIVLALS